MTTALLDRRPIVVAVAGPNGAGKSTFYRAHLAPSGLRFVNADQLALQLKLDPYRAAELAGQIRGELIARRESFIFETVFSDPVGDKVDFLLRAARGGYTVALFFIGISSARASEERVSMRVLKGGHDVPTGKIRERYGRTMENLRRALAALPNVWVYDNSNLAAPYRLAAEVCQGLLKIHLPTPAWLKPLLSNHAPD
jgi:predicted ABC-type ATPase